MITIKIFGTNPPCANCIRAEKQVRIAAENFAGEVDVVKLDALGDEAEQYGIMTTPLIVINDEVVSVGKVLPAVKIQSIIREKLGG